MVGGGENIAGEDNSILPYVAGRITVYCCIMDQEPQKWLLVALLSDNDKQMW